MFDLLSCSNVQQMLDSLLGYCDKWSLTFNVDKTKILEQLIKPLYNRTLTEE